MAFLESFIWILSVASVLQLSSCDDYYARTFPAYSDKVVQGPIIERILLFNLTLTNSTIPVSSLVQRNNLDARCRLRCLTRDDGSCQSYQTYWTVDGCFYCELLGTDLCNSCWPVGNQNPGQLQSRIWELMQPAEYDTGPPCYVLPDWKVPGNCSLCGKIGFYGRNCSLRSSCASYFYESPSPQVVLTRATTSTIQPCFTQGSAVTTWCRGPFTHWFTSKTQLITGFWSNIHTFYVNYYPLLKALDDASNWLGSIERNLLIATSAAIANETLLLYSGFVLGPGGTLTLQNLTKVIGKIQLKDGFKTPVENEPFLKGLSATCGPMWGSDQMVFLNSTHTDTCNSYTAIFASINRWADVNVHTFVSFVDVDYFQC